MEMLGYRSALRLLRLPRPSESRGPGFIMLRGPYQLALV